MSDVYLHDKLTDKPITDIIRVERIRLNANVLFEGKTYEQDAKLSDSVWQISRIVNNGDKKRFAGRGQFNLKLSEAEEYFKQFDFENKESVQFDGIDANIVLSSKYDLTGGEALSCSLWIMPQKTHEATLIHYGHNTYPNDELSLTIEQGRLQVYLCAERGNAIACSTLEAIQPDKWQHVVLTYDGTLRAEGLKLYLNGNECRVIIQKNQLNKYIKSSGCLKLGSKDKYDYYYGKMDEISLHNKQLSIEEVKEIHNNGSPGDVRKMKCKDSLVHLYDVDRNEYPQLRDRIGKMHGEMKNMVLSDIQEETPDK